MKMNRLLIILVAIFYIVTSCEDVIKLENEIGLRLITDNDTTQPPPHDTTDTPVEVDTLDPIPDSIYNPDDYPLCDTVWSLENNYDHLWNCAIEGYDPFIDYSLLTGTYFLSREQNFFMDEDHTDEYYDQEYDYTITFNEDHTFIEVFQSVCIQTGVWETHPENGNRLWLLNDQGELTIYNILNLGEFSWSDGIVLKVVTLDHEQRMIIDKEFLKII